MGAACKRFQMKLGISAFAWTSEFRSSHLELLPPMKQLGLIGVEIPMFDPVRLPVDSIREAFEKNQLDCTVCAILPEGINPISPKRETRQRAIEHLERCIERRLPWVQSCWGGHYLLPSAICRNTAQLKTNGRGQLKSSRRLRVFSGQRTFQFQSNR